MTGAPGFLAATLEQAAMAGRGLGYALSGVKSESHERAQQFVHGSEAVLRILLQTAHDDLLETGGQIGPYLGQGKGRGIEMLARYLGHARAVERRVPGQHLVEHNTQRVDVRAGVDRLAADLLRRHVTGAADDGARARDPGPVGAGGDAEVGDLGVTLPVDEDVLGFDVAVDDACQMRRRQSLSHLPRNMARFGRRQRAAASHLLERASFHILEDQVVLALRGTTIDEGDHVGMGELGEGPAFAVETRPGAGVLVERWLQPLYGHVALQPRIPGLVDDAHAPTAQDPSQPVAVLQERGFAALVILVLVGGVNHTPTCGSC